MDFLNPDSLPTELRDTISYKNLATGQTLFFQGDSHLAPVEQAARKLLADRTIYGLVTI